MKASSKILGVVVIVAAISFLIYFYNKKTTPTYKQVPIVPSVPMSNDYKDGTYSTVSDYVSPGGKNSLGITITLSHNTIAAVSVKNMAGDKISSKYQNSFINGIKSVAVGKSIIDFQVAVVSGSSLASGAFNAALVQIRAQAQSTN